MKSIFIELKIIDCDTQLPITEYDFHHFRKLSRELTSVTNNGDGTYVIVAQELIKESVLKVKEYKTINETLNEK